MNDNKRSNEGYKIIESHTIGKKEFVIGHNPNAPNPFVCWHCKNGIDFYWGFYCNTLQAAQNKLHERCNNAVHSKRDTRQVPPQIRDAHER